MQKLLENEKCSDQHLLWSNTQKSATLYFLIKTCFNGLWRTNKNGQFKGTFGSPSGKLNQKNIFDHNAIRHWNNILQDVTLTSLTYSELDIPDASGVCCFLDPPYRVQDLAVSPITYSNTAFTEQDQIALVNLCKSKQHAKMILCNRELHDGFFDRHRGDLNIRHYRITYTASRSVDWSREQSIEISLNN